MSTEFHLRVREILEQVAAARHDRTALLRGACAGDTRLLREARALLPHFLAAGAWEPRAPECLAASLPGTTTLLCVRREAAAAVVAEAEPSPPFSLDTYTVVQVLGRGGMGVVYRAIQPAHGREVAIKILRRQLRTAEDRRRFAFEAELLRQLQHPGIARCSHSGIASLRPQTRGAWAFEQRPYFVMEFVRGHPLTWYASARGLGARQRLALLVQVCEAVDYAHYRGIVHCDLKPDNILVDEVGHPRIVDFGIARFSEWEGAADAVRGVGGTRAYASPEQVLGRIADISPASDVYALGVISHELLADVRPRQHGWALELDLAGVRLDAGTGDRGQTADDRVFAWELRQVLAAALRQTRGRAFHTAGELGVALAELLARFPDRPRSLLAGARDAFGTAARVLTSPLQGPLRAVLRSRVNMSVESTLARQDRPA
ncbi:MAG: serine/threonine-protein kinase [Planctomycetota bacterium]